MTEIDFPSFEVKEIVSQVNLFFCFDFFQFLVVCNGINVEVPFEPSFIVGVFNIGGVLNQNAF